MRSEKRAPTTRSGCRAEGSPLLTSASAVSPGLQAQAGTHQPVRRSRTRPFRGRSGAKTHPSTTSRQAPAPPQQHHAPPRRPLRRQPPRQPMQIRPHTPRVERRQPRRQQRPGEPRQHVPTPRRGQPPRPGRVDPHRPAPESATNVVDPFNNTVAPYRPASSRTDSSRAPSTTPDPPRGAPPPPPRAESSTSAPYAPVPHLIRQPQPVRVDEHGHLRGHDVRDGRRVVATPGPTTHACTRPALSGPRPTPAPRGTAR